MDKHDFWSKPAVIARNNFVYKSLSCWSLNTAVGCAHACRFCYVPDVSTRKLQPALSQYGVQDPDAEWGEYVLVRPWDERVFLASLQKANWTAIESLNRDGNRAVMLCTTTDPFQIIRHPDPERRKELQGALELNTERALQLILENSTLNVRILTRSPLARRFFPWMKAFGHRLTFGMSIPTLNNTLAKVYEPKAPSPSQRLATLKAAKDAGLHIFAAMAPTYPECDADDLHRTLSALKELNPITIYHEPINIRAENVERIRVEAEKVGVNINTSVFSTTESWRAYALEQLMQVEEIAASLHLPQLHLWPDKSLGSKSAIAQAEAGGHRTNHQLWLNKWWQRIAEWPAAI